MSRRFGWTGLALWISLTACAPSDEGPSGGVPDLTALKIVDLSHDFGDDTLYWPTATRFTLEEVAAGVTSGGFFYAANRFSAAEHGGTHLDAPIHFGEGRQTVDRLALERLIGGAVVIDVEAACQNDPGYVIGVAELERWEAEHGTFPEDAIALFRTGFAKHWPDPARYLGTALRGQAAVPALRFPGLAPEAAGWLVARRVRALGIDTASIDPGASSQFESHRVLAAAGVPVFENLARLDELPPRGFSVVALPMKIRGGSGAPLRAIALLSPATR